MNSSTYRFNLDLHSTQSQISIPVTQGDTARELYISLSDGSVPYLIADGCLAVISIKRPTGTHLEAFCLIENNTTIKFDFEWEPCTADIEGVHDCSITLYDADGKKIGSPRFTMVVSARVILSGDINITDEDKSAIDAMIAAEVSRQAAETGRVNKEAERQDNENQRKLNEEGREAASAEAVQRANTIAETLERKLANGEFNGSDANVDLSPYYTKTQTEAKIAEAITTTLNTEV